MKILRYLFLISLIILFVFNLKGNVIENELYSFQIPENWDTIPIQILDYQANLMNEQTGENVHYQCGIFKLDSANFRSYPYILIQHIPIRNINKYKFDKIAKEFSTGISKKVKDLPDTYSFYMGNFQTDEILVDREEERLVYIFDMNDLEFGKICGYSVFKLVGTGVLAFHCYSLKMEIEKDIQEFESFIENIKIKNKYEYKSSIFNSKHIDILVKVFIAIIAILGLKRYLQKKKSNNH